MAQQQQALPLDEPQQLTGWLEGKPPTPGWYNTRRKDSALARGDRARARRFWDGTRWSRPVIIGLDTDAQAEAAKCTPSVFDTADIIYQGLAAPHP